MENRKLCPGFVDGIDSLYGLNHPELSFLAVEFQAASHSLGKMQGSGKERITESDTVFITEVATRGTHRGKVAKSFRDNTRRSRSDLLTNIGCLDKMTRLLLAKPTR